MKALKKRIEMIESKAGSKKNLPSDLKEFYQLEKNPDSEIGKSFIALYDPDRETINPTESLK